MNKSYSEIEKILDYKFKDIKLLDEALTHSSIKKINKQKKIFNYERLEFLGDRILGFVISDLIFKKFPNFQEGDLSILFQKYTNTKFLSNVAINLNLNKFVIVQKGDSLEKKDSIMSDLIESSDNDFFDNTIKFKVPKNKFFFMGDNRDNSKDSRASEVGFVPKINLIGKAQIIFFSHNGSARFYEFWKWHKLIRFSRIGKKIE